MTMPIALVIMTVLICVTTFITLVTLKGMDMK